MPSSHRKTRVLLLKTKSHPEDGYENYFRSCQGEKYEPVFVPVLEHYFIRSSLEGLKQLVLRGDFTSSKGARESSGFGGLIFTSQRAVEAFAVVVDGLRRVGRPIDELLPRSLQLYVVGPATARSLEAIGLQCAVEGEESGSGEALAPFILDHYNRNYESSQFCPARKPSLLFLVGEQRRDVIPNTLQNGSLAESNQIKVEELAVYDTGVMESFPQDFQVAVKPALLQQSPQWIIIFSPTGCKVMLECLGLLDQASGKVKDEVSRGMTRVGTIGPTTRNYLRREFDLEPDVCASKPSPEGIGIAIAEWKEE